MRFTPNVPIAVDETIVGAIRTIRARAAMWYGTCAEYAAVAATYEQLSTLSDAELRRRGLSRATLARDVLRGL
jgi:hypothetical protein